MVALAGSTLISVMNRYAFCWLRKNSAMVAMAVARAVATAAAARKGRSVRFFAVGLWGKEKRPDGEVGGVRLG